MIKETDKIELMLVIRKSNDPRAICRANALNMRTKGLSAAEVADFLEITSRTVFNIEQNYLEGGLTRALNDDPRPGAPKTFDARVEAYIVATVCSDPPEGFDRWTLVMLRDNAIKKGIVDSISRESIRLILQEHDLKPWQQKSWCVPDLDSEYIERMEDVLEVYERPVDPSRPLVCVDEKPIQLLDDVRPGTGLKCGQIKKQDFEYKRNGTANVFCAVAPHEGRYINLVTENRKGKEFAKFLGSLERRYSSAEKIVLVMDNLNIHSKKSLTNFYGEDIGSALWERFEVHYTPKHGSWLNQAEIAINIYARQSLGNTRIPDIDSLRKRTAAWNKIANQKKVKIKWTFNRAKAKEKFGYV
jgi:transposase